MLMLHPRLQKEAEPKLLATCQLVQQIRERNISAMEILYDEYAAVIYGYIAPGAASSLIAEEICAKIFLRIWKEIGTYDEEKCRLFTWMFSIVKQEAAAHSIAVE